MAKPVSLATIVSDQIPLEKYDDSGDTWVQFQQPTAGDEEAIEALGMGDLMFNEEGRQQIINRKGISHGQKLQMAYCLIGSNLPTEEEGLLVFEPGKTCREQERSMNTTILAAFSDRWDRLPRPLREEMLERLYEFYLPFSGF